VNFPGGRAADVCSVNFLSFGARICARRFLIETVKIAFLSLYGPAEGGHGTSAAARPVRKAPAFGAVIATPE
jgi:hypothetical protein